MNARAAMRNGLIPDRVGEVLLQVGVYAGVPAANRACKVAQQTLRQEAERARLRVLVVAACDAQQDPQRFWQVRMWSDNANRWVPQPAGIAHFHAGPIGSAQHGRGGAKAVQTRLHVESISDALPAGPVALLVDAMALRSIYPGLQNHHFGVGALPAISLTTAQRDVAIVRCNTSREVPRPVHRNGGHQPGDPRQPAAPDRYVYQLASSNVWLFPKSSRIYRAKGRQHRSPIHPIDSPRQPQASDQG